ncbi:hypothetical protein [Paraflavitalea sp. CAU 1676]|uniref:hypothetical protein n=1 Tax=Paraflavitalea sp. CAU 1676 TaxID=3032598 RepID=UPI0023DA8E14|nr:hypothetical protein [Paraflavitalea sp. CAU 1676]MDF2188306.1 hypothetical protein [Paraflavitalea sp. CAU 1676]
MTKTENMEDMDESSIKLVLAEFGENQENLINEVREQKIIIDRISRQLAAMEEKMEIMERSRLNDRKGDQVTLQAGLRGIHALVQEQRKSVVHEKRYLFFPEHNMKQFVNFIYGRLALWLLAVLFGAFLLKWLWHWSDEREWTRREELKTFRYQQAWRDLYQKESKANRRKMDSVWQRSWHD